MCCEGAGRELRGWCRSFTRTERLLTLLEAALLAVLIAFLVFLILHLSVCPEHLDDDVTTTTKVTLDDSNTTDTISTTSKPWTTTAPNENITDDVTSTGKTSSSIECTWDPSHRTSPGPRYYDLDGAGPTSTAPSTAPSPTASPAPPQPSPSEEDITTGTTFTDFPKFGPESDGEEARGAAGGAVLALLKLPDTFGCALAVVARRWALTAASCIEAIEEVDSLDSFVMVERYGTPSGVSGRAHAVSDLRVHPRYRRGARSYDLAALRALEPLLAPPAAPLPLAGPLDDAFITIGEQLTIVGFGHFRTTDQDKYGRQLRATTLVRLPPAACAPPAPDEPEETWALRHLWGGAPADAGEPGAGRGPVCAGVRWARGSPCHYCGGTPLLAGAGGGAGAGAGRARLLGVMARAELCGAACEATPFVNIADVADWVEAVIQT